MHTIINLEMCWVHIRIFQDNWPKRREDLVKIVKCGDVEGPHYIHIAPHYIHNAPQNVHNTPQNVHITYTFLHNIHIPPYNIHIPPHNIHIPSHYIHIFNFEMWRVHITSTFSILKRGGSTLHPHFHCGYVDFSRNLRWKCNLITRN